MSMNKTFQSLSDTFGIENVQDVVPKNEISTTDIVVVPEDSTVEDDAKAVRNILFNLLKQGEDAFTDLKSIAVSEESPRAFEVLNGMLSNLSDIAIKLMDVHEKQMKIQKAKAADAPASEINNNGVVNNNTIFVGTTADLQNAIKQLNKDE